MSNRYIFSFILFLFCSITLSQGQDVLHVYIEDEDVALEEQICMSVKVNHFDSIQAFQLSINFDPYLLDFDSIGNMNAEIGLNEGFFGLQEKHLGIVRLTFFDAFNHFSLADSTVLFDLCFTAYGMPGELCPVNVADYPLPLEFISNDQIVDEFSRRDARVNILGGDELTVITSTCKTGIEDTTGVLSIAPYGGNPPYFILWQHTFNSNFSGGFGIDTFGDVRVVENLIEGRYRITITDEDGNRFVDSLNLRKANDLVYSTEINHPLCDNTDDGFIILDSIQGGIVPAQFKWSDGRMFSTERFGLFAGEYGITITDPLGCRTLDTFLLEANSIQVETMKQDESCLGSEDGRFLVNIFGGDPVDSIGYHIFYENDTFNGLSFQDSLLSIGSYQMLIEDSLGCEKEVELDINLGLSFGIDELNVEQVGCFGENSGSIFLKPKTLTGEEILPYSFEWTGTDSVTIDSSSILLHHLSIGTYTITVANELQSDCTWDTTFIISQPPFMSVQTSNVVPASCDPGNDGEATISILGGTPDGDGGYLIIWPTGEDSTTAIMLPADTVEVRVIDLEGCRVDHQVVVPNTDPPALIGSSIRDMRCDSAAVGSILTVFSTPFGVESYRWSTGDSTSSIDDIKPGLYEVTVTDRNGCLDTFQIKAYVPEGPTVNDLIISGISCPGEADARLDVVYELGAADLDRIEWNGVVGSDSLTDLGPGGYKVIIYDENECIDSAATTLVDPLEIEINFNVTDDVGTAGTGQIEATVTGGWTPYEFRWTPDSLPMDSVINNLFSGFYFLEIEDAEGCLAYDTAFVDDISAVSNLLNDEELQLFPNPVFDRLSVSIESYVPQKSDEILILDMHGKTVHQLSDFKTANLEINTSNFASGFHLFMLKRSNKILFQRAFLKH